MKSVYSAVRTESLNKAVCAWSVKVYYQQDELGILILCTMINGAFKDFSVYSVYYYERDRGMKEKHFATDDHTH
jgi:hypothetical protein